MGKSLPVVAIVGRANVGKSSLFNAVLRRRETIVAKEAGTTRDSISARTEWQGKSFWLVDTAGMKSPDDDFEFTIQEQIAQAAESADIILVFVKTHTIITQEDRRVAKLALKTKKPVILVANKADHSSVTKTRDRVFLLQKLGIKKIFLTSAIHKTGLEELLNETAQQVPKVKVDKVLDKLTIALLGRPNVGKSSLFNALAKKQQVSPVGSKLAGQAVVAKLAGTTRDINRVQLKYKTATVELLDTAGIRRSGKIERGVEHFSVLRSLSAIQQADVCLLLIDANEARVQLDQKIAGMIKEAGRGLILAIAKWDSLEEKDPKAGDRFIAAIKNDFPFVPWAPVIFTSAVSGQNITKIFDLVTEIKARRAQRLTTPQLNKWLKQATAAHPPAGLKNRQPKLKYVVQEDDATNFKIFGSQTKFLHWSYKRYLERKFREQFDFSGTPIKFWFIEKNSRGQRYN